MASLEAPSSFAANITPVPLESFDFESQVVTAIESQVGTPCRGHDSADFQYESLFHLWAVERRPAIQHQKESEPTVSQPSWYANALGYWDACEPTVEGMLGGFGVLDPEDVTGSTAFLKKIWEMRPDCGKGVCVDCGGGIGRVTKHLLLPLFEKVHLLEQSPPLIAAAPDYLGEGNAARTELLCVGMQAFVPEAETYDVVWSQWVIGHLSDADFVAFLHRCKRALKRGGVICLKDNTFPTEKLPKAEGGGTKHFCVDREDSSITRSEEYFEACFKVAGLTVLRKERQRNFPEELYPVLMYALV
jgi:protein N-terminal methyltransferase